MSSQGEAVLYCKPLTADILIRRLQATGRLSMAEQEALKTLPFHARSFGSYETIISQGGRSTHCCVVLEGWVARTKISARGRQTILSIHVPGDIPDLQSLYLDVIDHSLTALAPTVAGFVSHAAVKHLIERVPQLAATLWRETLIDAAMARDWVAMLASQAAEGRVAHLICTLYTRLEAVGLACGHQLPLPLTQQEIGEALGLSAVHTNRVVQRLRRSKLLSVAHKRVTINDWQGLIELAEFNASHLHLNASEAPEAYLQ